MSDIRNLSKLVEGMVKATFVYNRLNQIAAQEADLEIEQARLEAEERGNKNGTPKYRDST